jgi:hypothetical protein
LRDGADVDVAGDGAAGASVADGMWFSGSTGNPACACVKTRLVRARRARSKNAFFGFLVLRRQGSSNLRHRQDCLCY